MIDEKSKEFEKLKLMGRICERDSWKIEALPEV